MPSSHLILCRPLLLLPPIPPSIRVFSNESTLHMRWPKYWSFSFSIIPSKEHPRTDLLQNGLAGSPCSPRDSQESSLIPQFKLVSYFETHYIGGERNQGPRRHRVEPTFPIELWRVYEVAFIDKMLRTNNSSEAFTTQYKAWLQTFILVLGN